MGKGTTWLAQELSGQSYRHALGYNAEEQSRIAKSERAFAEREPAPVRMAFGFNSDEESRIVRAAKYDTALRKGFYPLFDWKWSRDRCLQYLHKNSDTLNDSVCVFAYKIHFLMNLLVIIYLILFLLFVVSGF